jgi:1,4-alpha-glucan branching enzyme
MDMDVQEFYRGRAFCAYEHLGAHVVEEGTVFRTFAPAADGITILRDGFETPMERVSDGNFWEGYVPGAKPGDAYEYRIYRNGGYVDHCDPYGYGMELRPAHRSIIRDLGAYRFRDDEWMASRTPCVGEALNIYELHAGSWRKRKDGPVDPEKDGGVSRIVEPEDWYSYDELAEPLIDYLREGGYTHVEFMPLAEHPVDQSWGYQDTGFYAPTSRYGTIDQLKELVDRLHQAGIGTIIDFVPVHFATDAYALRDYDGTALFEYPNDAVGVSEWGSCNFMHSRGETCSFLQSCGHFWLKELHFDGLRMDAISRIIYWQGDQARGVNANAVDFIKTMNSGLKSLDPGCMLCAEDSTDFPGTTREVGEGGLGFDYKWDMGWMNDTLDYFKKTPDERRDNYHKLTFSMMYFPNEHYLLPLSHDENVHGKATVLNKMWGDYEGKFPQARSLYLYMTVHPGKKLNFMGGEFGQMREWDETRQQDWDMLAYPLHDAFRRFVFDLNHLYLEHAALFAWDYYEPGFKWLDCHEEERCLYAIERTEGNERLVCVLNLGGAEQADYRLDIPGADAAEVLVDTEWDCYGGSVPRGETAAELVGGQLRCTLPAFSGFLLRVSTEAGE